ncbi:amino acid ABC transporter substrate-binding protein [Litchfieldella qijiaojingensis]|uniref:Amino acid ABC transporter substrate-binding protein n=1 Tax=Litchfieldella qijiaojingensis TaxID=980347 RepID=A0ABQ2YPV6_9GAMM|nr:ABC transporter substrate-binding protein [Halomonas qijiaojingensis]GGX89870.1 amino acid ABC transporter substrate-binding protein [Halomonas qijiaojingensis]
MNNTRHTGTGRHRAPVSAALGVFTLSAVLAAGGASAQDAPPAIKVGQIAPFTGAGAEFGEFYRDGAALGVDHINAATQEVLGGPVIAEHLSEDSNTLPTPAIQAARQLVEVEGVPAIIGGWSSGVTVAVATSVTIPSEVLQISNGSTSPLISVLPEDLEADLLFRTTASDALQGVVAAQLARGEIFEDYSVDSASTIFINNPYGQGLSNAFARAFQARGGTITAQVPHPEEPQPTYTSQLAQAFQGDPEMLLAASYPGHSATFLQEARDIFDQTVWQFVDGNRSQEVIDAVGADDLEGLIGTAPGQDPSIPGFENFATAFEEAYGHDRIPPFTESAYDAAMLIGLATVKAIADGHDSVEAITGTVLRDRLREVANPPGMEIVAGDLDSITAGVEAIMNGEDVAYTGAAGPADFDDSGDVITPIAIWKYTNGSIENLQIQSPDDIPAE